MNLAQELKRKDETAMLLGKFQQSIRDQDFFMASYSFSKLLKITPEEDHMATYVYGFQIIHSFGAISAADKFEVARAVAIEEDKKK